jgi:hypothetical protein
MPNEPFDADLWLERPGILEREAMAQDVVVARPPQMLRAADIAVQFGCSAETVNRWGRRGVLPVVKIQGSNFYRASDVEALLMRGLERSIERVHAVTNRRPKTEQ